MIDRAEDIAAHIHQELRNLQAQQPSDALDQTVAPLLFNMWPGYSAINCRMGFVALCTQVEVRRRNIYIPTVGRPVQYISSPIKYGSDIPQDELRYIKPGKISSLSLTRKHLPETKHIIVGDTDVRDYLWGYASLEFLTRIVAAVTSLDIMNQEVAKTYNIA